MKRPKRKKRRDIRPRRAAVATSPIAKLLPNVVAWCEGKPFIIRISAKMLAVSPEEITDGMNEIRRREFPNPYPVTDPDRWHQCYYRQDMMRDYILRMMFNGDERVLYSINRIMKAFREVAAAPPSAILAMLSNMTQSEIMFEIHRAIAFWQNFERSVDAMIVEMETSKKPNEETRRLLGEPEVSFFVRIWAPCWFAHRTTPLQLLERAKSADFKIAKPAILKLFRLDRSLPLVSPFKEMLHQLAQDPARQHDYRQLTDALNAAPIAPAKLPLTQAFAAAPLLAIARAGKCKLTTNDIRKLFDAAARDRHGRNDLDNSDYDAFRKRMGRERKEFDEQVKSLTGTNPSSPMSQ